MTLILDEETLARSNAALDRGEEGEIEIEEACAEALAIEPRNAAALITLGGIRVKAEATAAARDCFWKAVRATPTRATPYLLLAATYGSPEDAEMARGLTWLGLEAASVVRAVPDAVHDLLPIVCPELASSGLDLSDPAMLAVLLEQARKGPAPQPEAASVTVTLRPYRWLMALCGDGSEADAAALLAEGRAHAQEYEPVLRAALSDALTYELGIHSVAACRLTALLGDIGDIERLSDLDELAGVDDLNIALHAQWGIWRMGQRFPPQTAAALASGLALEDWRWADTADQLYLLPAGTDITAAAARFGEKLRAHPKGLEADYALAVLQRALKRHGAEEELKQRIGALAHRLPRKSRPLHEEWLHAEPFVPQLAEDGLRNQDIVEVLDGDLFDEDLHFEDEPFDEEVFDDEEIFDERFPTDEADEPLPYADVIAAPAPPAPKLSRNDSCWCGSGKKYKKCHMEADEQKARQSYVSTTAIERSTPQPPHLRLRDRMTEELMSRAGKPALLAALGRYWGESAATEQASETDDSCFVDWLLFDFRMPNGKTPCEDYRDRHRAQLTTKELAQLEAWIHARYGLWEVQRVDEGTGMAVKNLATDEELFVHDVASTKQLVRWDVMLQRVEQSGDQNMFVGHGYTVPRRLLPMMWAFIDETCRRTGQTRADAIIGSSHELHRALKRFHQESLRNLRVENFDGDPMEFSEAAYVTAAVPELQALLRAQEDVAESEVDGGPVFRRSLPNKRDGDETTMATLVFEGGKLLLRCNSRKRLWTQRKWLEKLAGVSLVHVNDTFQSVEEARRLASENPAFQQKPEPPGEQEREFLQRYQDEHNAKWIDMELPALGGKTPRQASRSKAGRAALEELLRDLENSDARRQRETGVGTDFQALRKQLKLGE